MAVEDVLDEREAEAGAALGATVADVDAVEPFGQARQMLAGDAGTVIAYRNAGLASGLGRIRPLERDLDPLAGAAVLEGVLDQVLEHPGELVAVAGHEQRLRRRRDRDGDAALARQHLQG